MKVSWISTVVCAMAMALTTAQSRATSCEQKLFACDLTLTACGELVTAQQKEIDALMTQNKQLKKQRPSPDWFVWALVGVIAGGVSSAFLLRR